VKPTSLKYLALLGTVPLLSLTAQAGSVAVGDSSLITTLDYSDTFTMGSGATGTRNGTSYNAGDYPLYGNVGNVESAYGNPAQSWGNFPFSVNNNAVYYTASDSPTPLTGDPGSVDGFTQTGLADGNGRITDFGFAYGGGASGLRNNFVVQYDAVQLRDRNDIYISSSSNLGASDALGIFFRSGNIGLAAASVGPETLTGITATGLTYGDWENYAVGFDIPDNKLSFYTNGNLLGTINLNTFDGGAYAGVLDANSSAYIAIGGADVAQGDGKIGLLWTDNFQVGEAAVPEPSTYALLLGGLGLLGFWRLRTRRA
jgi:hypothetical protein